MVCLAFCPRNLDRWWKATNAIDPSMNVDGVVALLGGGGDTSTHML